MTTQVPLEEQIMMALEALLESKRLAAQRKEDFKQAKLARKQAEKTLKLAKKESRKASKREVQAQKLLDDLRRGIKKSKTRSTPRPTKSEDTPEPESPPATAVDPDANS